MSETEHEHDEGDEATGAPVADEAAHEEAEHEEAAHEAEQAADEPEEAPEQQATTQETWEKRFTYAEKLFETYRRKIFDKWEEDALTLVPFNIDSGAPPGFIDTRNAGHVDEDTKAAAMEFLGFPREQDYEADPDAQQCATCKGKTKTKTGSNDPAHATRTCPTCKGFGYTIAGRAPSDVAAPTNGATSVTLAPVEPVSTGDFDAWNQPRILPTGVPNPNFGKTPDYWISIPPWGDTRGLTAQDVTASV
jgi:hypothetical protein